MRYVTVEGLPAVGKSELLSTLKLYFPDQVLVFPELVKEAAEREGIDLFRERERLREAILRGLPRRQEEVRAGLARGLVVVEESHLGVHAAYSAAVGDEAFLTEFRRLEEEIVWPDVFIRLDAPIPVSRERQRARGDPRYEVGGEVLERMSAWLSRWHAERGDELVVVDADRSPDEVLRDLVSVLGLRYRSLPRDDVLPCLILLGRPAAGKSELIQFLRGLPPDERARVYHLGTLAVLDDFPILWEKFIEDDIWEAVGKGRLLSRRAGDNYYVTDDLTWPFLIEKLNRRIDAEPELPGRTVIVEFSRGGVDGYRDALSRLHRRALERGAILYLDVSVEESWRRNLARYDRARRDGILTHSVPWEEYERTYETDDWHALAPAASGYLEVKGVQVPYVTVSNEPEPVRPADFEARFKPALAELFRLWNER
jgi:thymidylate kinase